MLIIFLLLLSVNELPKITYPRNIIISRNVFYFSSKKIILKQYSEKQFWIKILVGIFSLKSI